MKRDSGINVVESKDSGGYLQNYKSIYTKVKKIDLRMHSCTPCS